jgi:hypothetical protein
MGGVFAAKAAIFAEFKLVGSGSLVFGCGVISPFALAARQCNNHSHCKSP